MTFLNGIMLFGLIGVSIPIIIHILNRRRAKMVQWGAMHFLESSLASRNRRILIEEIILMAIRCCLLAAMAFALARPFLTAGRLLPGRGGDAQDLAIVIDGSLSMTLQADGTSNFQRAVDQAHQLVQACRSGDAVSVVLAGPVAQPIIPAPISDRDEVHEALDNLGPTGGSMRVLEALNAAMETLSAGTNPARRVVLITDGQSVGWDLSASKRWEFLAEAAKAMPTKPVVIVRTLDAPQKWHNASAAALKFSRTVIGTDRPVKITATVANTGEGSIQPEAVELAIDDKTIERRTLGVIAEGASSSVVFDYQFTSPGPHVVSARIVCDDDLPGDNETARVVNVPETLPVLIVEGASSTEPFEGDTDFLYLAMALPDENTKTDSPLIAPTVISAADIASVKRFGDYSVVVLADVPRLPAPSAKELSDFVAKGGGLLIAPGEKANKDFYNNWKAPDGKRLTGCRFVNIRAGSLTGENGETFTRIAPGKINHPAMTLLTDHIQAAHINRHWVMEADEKEKIVSLVALLDNELPWLVERKLSRGVVLTLAAPLDREFSDLPAHGNCYVPLVHELIHYLAAPAQQEMNIPPGEQFVYTLPAAATNRSPKPGPTAEVADPAGRRTAVRLRKREQHWQANYSLTARPGLYRLILPDKSDDENATHIPFVVLGDPDESKLDLLADDDYKRAEKFIPLIRAESLGELTAAIRGGVPGSEIWQYVAVAILVLLAAEIATTRLIAQKRKMHLAEPITFGADRRTGGPAFAEASAGRPEYRSPQATRRGENTVKLKEVSVQ